MLRFRAIDLRPVLEEARANQNTVFLVKDWGIYLGAKGGSRHDDGRVKHLAYAMGCHFDKDEDWYDTAVGEAGGDDFVEEIVLTAKTINWVLEQHGDLEVELTETRLQVSTAFPESRFVPVAEYRHQTERLVTQAKVLYCACRDNHERASWRHDALRLLDDVTGIDCKRAGKCVLARRDSAFIVLKARINSVAPDGTIR